MRLFQITLIIGVATLPALAEPGLTTVHPDFPVLRRKPVNPVLGFTVTRPAATPPGTLESVTISLAGTTHPQDLVELSLLPGGSDPAGKLGAAIATLRPAASPLVFTPNTPLDAGASTFWVSVTLKDDADLDGRIAVSLQQVNVGGNGLLSAPAVPPAPQRIGVALRRQGDDGAHSYRIPGLVRTKAGSLIAVYDVRYKHCGDLPARIDVGVSRSTTGGQSWEAMRLAMHPGTMGAAYESDGVGDPAVVVDETTGRIWIAALWSHGNHAWGNSGPGLAPTETGQLLVTHSDDDGKSWAPLRNLTPMVKDPAWRLCFNGPGAGICMKDGTLVFPAQFRAADGGETQGKPFATILWSKDHGTTWRIGSGAKIDTTEAQVAELDDGSLMLNSRDNRGGSRTVMVTRDLGLTWLPHPTDRQALPEPVCMASLLRWDHPRHGTLFAFSNPASTRTRNRMTVKFSRDQGLTWPERWHLCYDERTGAGYSCLAPAGPDHLGVLYEGPCELYFLRLPLAECLK
jgi:sialidase-1